MLRYRFIVVVLAVAFVGLGAAGCSGSTGESVTTVESDVVFDRGSVPETVPDSFPIPDEAVVGATLVDANRGVTEMVLTFPADTGAVVTYYEENLPSRGYTIAKSDGSGSEWRIDFSGEDVDGMMGVQAGGSGVAAATVQFTER